MGKLDLILRIVQTAATVIIGAAASVLAYQQFKISKAKLKLDLYEKRLALFQATHGFVLSIANLEYDSHLNIKKAAVKFESETAERFFLFNEDVWGYLDELCRKARILNDVEAELSIVDQFDSKRSENVMRTIELRGWFQDQATDMVQVFRQYLSIKSLN